MLIRRSIPESMRKSTLSLTKKLSTTKLHKLVENYRTARNDPEAREFASKQIEQQLRQKYIKKLKSTSEN
jgi:hypothetical protein